MIGGPDSSSEGRSSGEGGREVENVSWVGVIFNSEARDIYYRGGLEVRRYRNVLRLRLFLREEALSSTGVVFSDVEGWVGRRLRAMGYNSLGSMPKSLRVRRRSGGRAPARFARFAYSWALSNSCCMTGKRKEKSGNHAHFE